MGSVFGKNLRLSIFGESHGAGIGMVLDGFPAGLLLDEDAILLELERRKPGKDPWSTARKEEDLPQILGGIYNGRTTGAPIAVFFSNNDTRSQDYEHLNRVYRPSHADFTGLIRFDGFNDMRGGGHFSGRLTTGMVYAGAVAKQLLSLSGISILGHVSQVAGVKDLELSRAVTQNLKVTTDFPMFSEQAAEMAKSEIEAARMAKDSIGAEITVAAMNVAAGVGNPIFESIESHVASALFSIPGVKGVSFGSGFELVSMRGSVANDCFYEVGGQVKTETNHSGGINGGISNGMPVVVHVAMRPTPSIAATQVTLGKTGKMEELQIHGRHDPCIGPRALPVVEALFAIALLDLLIGAKGNSIEMYRIGDI